MYKIINVMANATILVMVFAAGFSMGGLLGWYAAMPDERDVPPTAHSAGWSTAPSTYGSSVIKRP